MQASLSSPPVAPPTKKQRSSNTPESERDRLSVEADDAITRRRVELRRLQQMQTQHTASGTGTGVTATQGLLARAQNQLQPPQAGAMRGGGRPGPPPPAMPKPDVGVTRVRHSDIFPSALKASQDQVPARSAPPSGPPPPGGPPTGPPRGPPTGGPPTGPPRGPPGPPRATVARRLDVSFADNPESPDPRAKSAPPRRPPQPPNTPHAAAEAPEPRGRVGRPPPVTPGGPPPPPSNTLNAGRTPGPPKASASTTPGAKDNAPSLTLNAGRTPAPPKASASTTPGAALTAGHTPFPYKGTTEPPPSDLAPTPFANKTEQMPPSTGRRDLLRNMRANADTPPAKALQSAQSTDMKSPVSPELRLSQELLRTQQEKKEALDQVTRMGNEMVKLREESASAQKLEAVIQMADTEGEAVALDWARKHVQGGEQQVGFLSPMANALDKPNAARNMSKAMTPLSMSRNKAPVRKRMATPQPKGSKPKAGDDADLECLKEVAKCAVFEFEVQGLASYIVRRPFGLVVDKELWYLAGQRNSKMYEKTADVHNSSTLEVLAMIEGDKSILALYDESTARHRTKTSNGGWKEFGNVDERDKPLGSIMYIDGEANEKEYSLDDVFEGAVAARHHYCSSLVVAAATLRSQKKAQPSVPELMSEQPPPTSEPTQLKEKPKVETSEICVGTEDLPYPPAAKAAAPDGAEKEAASKPKSPSKPLPPPPAEDVTDVLSVFFSMFFGSIFWVIWSVFVRIPLRIISTTLYMLIGALILSVVRVYLTDDNGAEAMGAIVSTMYNRPGIV
jgi:hypothetical protein